MASTGLDGPYKLDAATITKQVSKTSAGAYALGRLENQTFYVDYVGRSDTDIVKRLNDHARDAKYPQFKFSYFSSAKAAFEKECALFHDFGGTKTLDNDVHPARPANSGWSCPACTVFD